MCLTQKRTLIVLCQYCDATKGSEYIVGYLHLAEILRQAGDTVQVKVIAGSGVERDRWVGCKNVSWIVPSQIMGLLGKLCASSPRLELLVLLVVHLYQCIHARLFVGAVSASWYVTPCSVLCFPLSALVVPTVDSMGYYDPARGRCFRNFLAFLRRSLRKSFGSTIFVPHHDQHAGIIDNCRSLIRDLDTFAKDRKIIFYFNDLPIKQPYKTIQILAKLSKIYRCVGYYSGQKFRENALVCQPVPRDQFLDSLRSAFAVVSVSNEVGGTFLLEGLMSGAVVICSDRAIGGIVAEKLGRDHNVISIDAYEDVDAIIAHISFHLSDFATRRTERSEIANSRYDQLHTKLGASTLQTSIHDLFQKIFEMDRGLSDAGK